MQPITANRVFQSASLKRNIITLHIIHVYNDMKGNLEKSPSQFKCVLAANL